MFFILSKKNLPINGDKLVFNKEEIPIPTELF